MIGGIPAGPGLGAPERLAWFEGPRMRQRDVTAMFDLIAPCYDTFTRRFSLAMDGRWKRRLVAEAVAGLGPAPRVLDLACGTGDLAALVAAARPRARVLGLDVSTRMIAAAEQRHVGASQPRFALGDMMELAFDRGSVDLVTVGYGLRNVPDHRVALREIVRVLRPGGRLAVLDFVRPRGAVWRWLFLAYLRLVGDCYGWCWHRDPKIYGYISRSVSGFLSADQLAGAVVDAGLRLRRRHDHVLGGIVGLQATRG